MCKKRTNLGIKKKNSELTWWNENEKIVNFIVAIINIAVALFVGMSTNSIANEAKIISEEDKQINEKQEQLIYTISYAESDNKYKIEDLEISELEYVQPLLNIEQGSIEELRVIKFDENGKMQILNPGWEFLQNVNIDGNSCAIDVEPNVTKLYNNKVYDYFFLYMKSGAGSEHLDLVYTEIDVTPKAEKVKYPMIKTKLDLLTLNLNNEDEAFNEMMNNYKIIHEYIGELPDNGMSMY